MYTEQCGGGLARQLADRYPKLEEKYRKYCEKHEYKYIELKGNVFFYNTNENKFIANIFSQVENFDTDYMAMAIALTDIKAKARERNMSIAIPYGIGCGIANGEWDKVYQIIKDIFENSTIKCTLYKLEE